MKPARRPHLDVWLVLLGLAVLVGLLLRIRGYSDSLNSDELETYFDVTGRSPRGIVQIVQGSWEVTPPLYLLLAGWTQSLGDPQDALRIVPFACGLLLMPLVWLLGTWTLDRRAATVASGVVALSPFLIFYSTEARAYGLMMVLVLGSTLALWRAVHAQGRVRDRGAWPWWALYGVCTCAAMYTHYTAALVLIGQGLWALAYHRDRWRGLVAANLLAAVAWLPWLSSYRADQDNPASDLIGLLDPFDLSTFKTNVLHWSIGHPLATASVRDIPGELALTLLALGGAVAVAGLGWELRRDRPLRRPSEGLALVVVLGLSAPLIGALVSAVGPSVFLPRNLLGSSPGLVLGLGALVTAPRAARLWIPAAALLLAGFAVGGLRMAKDDAQRPDYKGAAAYVLRAGGRDAVVVDLPGNSPGALTQLDAAIAPGDPDPDQPTILRLDKPTRAAQLHSAEPGGGGQFAILPIPTPQQIAALAAAKAHGRDIFLVFPGSRLDFAPPSVKAFLDALPPAYRPAGARRFEGFFGRYPVAVYRLRRGG